MRKLEVVEVTENKYKYKLIQWKCSVCGFDFLEDEDSNYGMEAQEVFSFSDVGGYSSVFGDGVEISIDICQHCFKKLLGDFVEIKVDW